MVYFYTNNWIFFRPIFGNDGIRPDIVRLKNGENFLLKHRACNLIEDPWLSQYSCPSFHAVFHSFTFIYVFYGQFLQTKIKDYPFFIFYIIIFAADFFFRVSNNCIYISHYIIGIIWWYTWISILLYCEFYKSQTYI